MSTSDTLLSFLKKQLNTAEFEYTIKFDKNYSIPYESQVVSGEIIGLPNEDEKVFPQYINVNEYYSPTSQVVISGTWFKLEHPENYAVEIYLLTDTYYLIDTCTLDSGGTWQSNVEISTGVKVIKLVDTTKSKDDPERFIEYPYAYFSNFTFRLYSLVDTEYLTDEVPIFDVGQKRYIFYTNKVTKGLKVGKVLQRVWKAGAYEYNVVALAGGATNIENGRLPSSYLIPENDPSYDKDGTKAKQKYGYMLNSRSWIYDIGLVLLTFTTSGDYTLCKEIINRLQSEQNENGSFNFSYDNYIGALFDGYIRTGAIAWCIWGMVHYVKQTGDSGYSKMLDKAGEWLLNQVVTDETDARYGLLKGGHGNYDENYEYIDEDVEWCSTEHQLSSLQALNGLYLLTEDEKYKKAAEAIHYVLIKDLYDQTNHRFYQGMTKEGVDKAWALDCVTWAALSTLKDKNFGIFSDEIFKTVVTEYSVDNAELVTSEVENRFNMTYASNQVFDGMKPYSDRDGSYKDVPNIVWSEGTLGFVLFCMRSGQTASANRYLANIESLLTISKVSGGVLYSTATYAELPWEFHVWECVASTCWLYLLLENPEILFPTTEYSTYDNDPVLLNQAEKILSAFPLTEKLKASLEWKSNEVSGALGACYLKVQAEESAKVEVDKYVKFEIADQEVNTKEIDETVEKLTSSFEGLSKADFTTTLNKLASKIEKGRLFVGIAPGIAETNGIPGLRIITTSKFTKEVEKEVEGKITVVKVETDLKITYDLYITNQPDAVMTDEKFKQFALKLSSLENNYEALQKNVANVLTGFVGVIRSTIEKISIVNGGLAILGIVLVGVTYLVSVTLVI